MVAKLTLINRQTRHMMVMLRHSRRHLRLLARMINNLMRFAHPTPLRLKPTQPVHIKTSTHPHIIPHFLFLPAYAKLELWKIGCWFD